MLKAEATLKLYDNGDLKIEASTTYAKEIISAELVNRLTTARLKGKEEAIANIINNLSTVSEALIQFLKK